MRPLLAPLVRRADDHLNDHMARAMTQFTTWNSQQCDAIREVELLADTMIREMARLQAQIALLEANLHDAVRLPNENSGEVDVRPVGPQPTSRAA